MYISLDNSKNNIDVYLKSKGKLRCENYNMKWLRLARKDLLIGKMR